MALYNYSYFYFASIFVLQDLFMQYGYDKSDLTQMKFTVRFTGMTSYVTLEINCW